jgi:hypothetical protein
MDGYVEREEKDLEARDTIMEVEQKRDFTLKIPHVY